MTQEQKSKLDHESFKIWYHIQEADDMVDGHWKTVSTFPSSVSEQVLKNELISLDNDRGHAERRVILVESRDCIITLTEVKS